MITEFGAESVRDGPATQRGSYQFQRRYTIQHLRIHASKPFVAGSIAWALRDFRVDPTWTGGAPAGWSTPPWNNKSLIGRVERSQAGLLRPAQALAPLAGAPLAALLVRRP